MNEMLLNKKRHNAFLPNEAEAKIVPASARDESAHSTEKLLHDLRVHQIELEMQNEELRKAHIALEEARDRYMDLYDFAPVAYITLSRQGLISEINLTGTTLLGVARAKLINRRFATLIAPQDCDRWHQLFANLFKPNDKKQSCDLKLIRADGSCFDAHVDLLHKEFADAPPTLRLALTDVSEFKQLHVAAAAFESREGMVITDANGVILRINQAFSTITGYTAGEAVGQKMSLLKSDRHGSDFYDAMWNKILTASAWQGEIWNRVKNGEAHPHRVTISAVKDSNNVVTHYVGAYTDITELKQAEGFERFRSRILELLAGDESLSGILDAIVRGIEQLNPKMLCSILLLDKHGKHLHHGVAPSLPDFYITAIDGIEIGMGVGSCGTAAATGERVIVDNIATHPYWTPYKELAARAGLGACWSQPIRSSFGQTLGTFAIYHHETRSPTEPDIYLIEQSARLASIAIEKNLAAEKIRDSEAHFRLLTEGVSDVVWRQDRDNRFTYISPADERLRGYRADEVIGRHFSEMLTAEGVAALRAVHQQRMEAEQLGIKTGTEAFEYQQRCKDGNLIWVEVLSTPERGEHGEITGYHGISRNISERKQAEERIRQLAFHDSLTQLPNRRLLDERLSQAMAASKRSGCYCAVMFLDLDNFKPLNDMHGHVAGDLLLIEVANRLKGCVREIDTIARFGGDEFVVMIKELDIDKAESIAQAGIVAEKIRTALAAPYMLKIHREGKTDTTVNYHCTGSIGVVVFVNHDMNPDDVLKWADTAMYQAKEAGRNSIRFYDLKT